MREGYRRWGERDRRGGVNSSGGTQAKRLPPVAHTARTKILGARWWWVWAAFILAGIQIGRAKGEGDGKTDAEAEVLAFPEGSKSQPAPGKAALKSTKPKVTRKVKEPVAARRSAAPASAKKEKELPEWLGPKRERTPVGALSAEAGRPEEGVTAPYGRLVKCELVFTVDSLALQAPIVGLVMEDVWWDGALILPAGTEVFSKAIPDRIAQRIGDDGWWTFVLPSDGGEDHGRELRVRGCALDRAEMMLDERGQARSWGLSDGASGLHGYVVQEADREKVKLFLVTALAGAVEGLARGMQTRVAAAGNAGLRGRSVVPATLENAGLEALGAGGSAALELLARQIEDEVKRHGAYVRVPAGKPFYVFVDQTLSVSEARVGLLRGARQQPTSEITK